MSIKKLQRYRTNNVPAVADPDGCWVADYAVTELEATNEELVKALEGLLYEFEGDPCYAQSNEVIAARKALASARGE